MIKKTILFLIFLYKISISPILGKNCRFYPSCSEYSCQAINKYGVTKGLFKTIKRIIRCNPFNRGGVDLP